MSSRERVQAALNHREPDRIPIDLGGHRCSGISAIAYRRLKEHLGISAGDLYICELCQQLAIVEPEVIQHFGCDVLDLGRAVCSEDDCWRSWELHDGTPCKVLRHNNLEKRGEDWFILADDGTPLGVKRKDLVFWGGGCDTQWILPGGTPQEVGTEVRRRIREFAPGGGFIFSAVHNIQANVPAENIISLLETARHAGTYPLSAG